MNANDHQTHDLYEPTCERCHEEMFGTEQDPKSEEDLIAGVNSWFAGDRKSAPTLAEWEAWDRHRANRDAEAEKARKSASYGHPHTLVKRFPLLKPHLNSLYGLSADPNTIDSERYARKARAITKRCADAMLARETSKEATQVHTLFVGLHRKLDWASPVALNAHLIGNTLDAADLICSAASLDDCTCISDPELICFSEDHLN